jgi:hypothetical protein
MRDGTTNQCPCLRLAANRHVLGQWSTVARHSTNDHPGCRVRCAIPRRGHFRRQRSRKNLPDGRGDRHCPGGSGRPVDHFPSQLSGGEQQRVSAEPDQAQGRGAQSQRRPTQRPHDKTLGGNALRSHTSVRSGSAEVRTGLATAHSCKASRT